MTSAGLSSVRFVTWRPAFALTWEKFAGNCGKLFPVVSRMSTDQRTGVRFYLVGTDTQRKRYFQDYRLKMLERVIVTSRFIMMKNISRCLRLNIA